MGGQTALNTALSLRKMGVLDKFGITMIGATADAIDKAEDRERFREAMTKIGLATPRSHQIKTLIQALEALEDIGLPAIIRPHSRSPAPAAALPTTSRSLLTSSSAASMRRPPAKC